MLDFEQRQQAVELEDQMIESPELFAEQYVMLQAFAQRIMRSWPEGDVDGGELQDVAVDCGLISKKYPAPIEPCSENCVCAEYYGSDEFSDGDVQCYQPTHILTGQLMSPNA